MVVIKKNYINIQQIQRAKRLLLNITFYCSIDDWGDTFNHKIKFLIIHLLKIYLIDFIQ